MTFTLEDAGTRTLTTRGVRFRKRDYVGPWMTGQAGIQVRVRFMPHHDHRIEVYHAATRRYLGPADLADQATEEQISAVRRARSARARRLKKDLEASQRERYAAVNQPEAPRRLGALTTPGPPVRHPYGRDGASAPDGPGGRAAPPTTDEDGDAS